jgi:hypothetical protein
MVGHLGGSTKGRSLHHDPNYKLATVIRFYCYYKKNTLLGVLGGAITVYSVLYKGGGCH